MTKTHWLFGRGPDKLLDFKREIHEETECSKCIHREVCDRNMEKRCYLSREEFLAIWAEVNGQALQVPVRSACDTE